MDYIRIDGKTVRLSFKTLTGVGLSCVFQRCRIMEWLYKGRGKLYYETMAILVMAVFKIILFRKKIKASINYPCSMNYN